MTDDHQPVMVEEVLHFLAPTPGGVYIDGTLGAGGHAEAILRSVGGRCTLIGVDRDPDALARARFNLASYSGSVRLVGEAFGDLKWICESQHVDAVDGLLLDLGMSSMQVDDPSRGFSFRTPGPLDMRMDPNAEPDAAEVVNTYPPEELQRILRTYGEERNARRIARAIVDARRRRPIRTTTELAEIVEEAYPGADRRRAHPARKTFQALRIEVNDELGQLAQALDQLPDVLASGARVVILSYHSLEDRMVKRAFDRLAGPKPQLPGAPPPPGADPVVRVLTRGAVLPSEAEVERNPRASSARLRAAERLPRTEGR